RGVEAFGLGDVKLLLSLAMSVAWLGWTDTEAVLGPLRLVLYAVLGGFLVGGVVGLAATGFRARRHIPFGPALMAGWFAVVLLADSIRGWRPPPRRLGGRAALPHRRRVARASPRRRDRGGARRAARRRRGDRRRARPPPPRLRPRSAHALR